MHKDLQLLSEIAYEANKSLPFTDIAKVLYGLAKKAGWGSADLSALIAYLKKPVTLFIQLSP